MGSSKTASRDHASFGIESFRNLTQRARRKATESTEILVEKNVNTERKDRPDFSVILCASFVSSVLRFSEFKAETGASAFSCAGVAKSCRRHLLNPCRA